MDWNMVNQQGDWEILDSMGQDLSAILSCPVRYCAYQYEKPLFECKCNKIFPRFAVESAQSSGDWSDIIQHHKEVFESTI